MLFHSNVSIWLDYTCKLITEELTVHPSSGFRLNQMFIGAQQREEPLAGRIYQVPSVICSDLQFGSPFFRFQQRICSDQAAVQSPLTRPAFSTLEDAVSRLLPYHTCAGHLPTQEDFSLGQQALVAKSCHSVNQDS